MIVPTSIRKVKVFNMKQVEDIPVQGDTFRIGKSVGICLWSTKWFAIMQTGRYGLGELIRVETPRTDQEVVRAYIAKIIAANPNNVIQDELCDLYDNLTYGQPLSLVQQSLLQNIR